MPEDSRLVLVVNGRVVMPAMHPTDTLADLLQKLGLRGTKVVCEQGGCGACSVILSYWHPKRGEFVHRTVNACLVPLVYANYMAVLTVEGIGSTTNPHPIQRLIAENNGSQCGYCTPGFVVAMYGKLLNKDADESMVHTIASNLCRCTGYRPIAETAKMIEDMKLKVEYPFELPDILKIDNLNYAYDSTLSSLPRSVDRASYIASTTDLFEAMSILSSDNTIKAAAGFSELLVLRSDHNSKVKETEASKYLATWRIWDMIHVEFKEDGTHIGASTTINDIKHAIKANKQAMENPRLAEMARIYTRFASNQVRNCATIGGNVCHGSPVCDNMPLLLSADAIFVVISLKDSAKPGQKMEDQYNIRYINARDWMKGYLKTDLKQGEMLYEIIIPNSTKKSYDTLDNNMQHTKHSVNDFYVRSFKLSRRYDDDIAVVGGCLEVAFKKQPKKQSLEIDRFRVSYASMSTTTVRFFELENLIEQKYNVITENPADFKALVDAITNEISKKYTLPKNVPGGMGMYRSELAQNIVIKFLLNALKDVGFKFGNNKEMNNMIQDGSYICIPEGIDECAQYYEGKDEFDIEKNNDSSEYNYLKTTFNNKNKKASEEGKMKETMVKMVETSLNTKYKNNTTAFGKPVVHQSALQQATGEANYLSTMKEIFNNNIDNNIQSTNTKSGEVIDGDRRVIGMENNNTCLYMYPLYAGTTYGKIVNIEEVKNYYNNRYSKYNVHHSNNGYLRVLTAMDMPNYANKNLNKNTSTWTTHPSNVGINRVGVSGLKDEPVLMTNGDDILAPGEMIAVVVCETMRAAKKVAAEIKNNIIFAKTKEDLKKAIGCLNKDNVEAEENKKLIIDVSDLSYDKSHGNIVTNISDFVSYWEQAEQEKDSEAIPTVGTTVDLIKKHVLCVKDLYFSENNRYKDYRGTNLELRDMKAVDGSKKIDYYKNNHDDFMKLFDITGLEVYKENDRVYKPSNGPRNSENYRIYYTKNNTENPYCIIESTLSLHHQEHFYFETHCTLANVENAHISNTSISDDVNERELINMDKSGETAVEEPKVTLSLTTTTQNISGVANNVSAALSIPTSRVNVNICNNRIGGGFGGKESTFQQQTACALASLRSNTDGSIYDSKANINYHYRPVYTQSSRTDDMKYSGKRHPFTFYNLARLNLKTMKIEALQVILMSDSGYAMDLSGSVMERAVFHATNSYYVPNIKIVGYCIRTRANSNTAYRGFGAPQAITNIEMLMERADKFKHWYWNKLEPSIPTVFGNKASEYLSTNIRLLNLLRNGNILPYGGAIFGVTLHRLLNTPLAHNNKPVPRDVSLDGEDDGKDFQLDSKKIPGKHDKPIINVPYPMHYVRDSTRIYNDNHGLIQQYNEMKHSYAMYNKNHSLTKRGVGLVPVTFGITFTQRFLNQTSAMVALHKDGSFAVSHCGIEMGQGIDTKMRQLAAQELQCDYSKVTIQQASSTILPNGPPTSASSAADLNGYAIIDAVAKLRKELEPVIEEVGRDEKNPNVINWAKVAGTAFMRRMQLEYIGHYSSKCEGYNFVDHKGTPFGYYSFSSALVGVEVDVMTGEYKILRGAVCVDVGASTNHTLDIGQVEGAFVQGLGYIMEDFILLDVIDRATGERIDRIPLSNGPGNYKIPSILEVPESFSVALLSGSRNPKAPHSGKGVGEPPLCLGASLMVALQDAVDACYEDKDTGAPQIMHPCTMESIKNALPKFSDVF